MAGTLTVRMLITCLDPNPAASVCVAVSRDWTQRRAGSRERRRPDWRDQPGARHGRKQSQDAAWPACTSDTVCRPLTSYCRPREAHVGAMATSLPPLCSSSCHLHQPCSDITGLLSSPGAPQPRTQQNPPSPSRHLQAYSLDASVTHRPPRAGQRCGDHRHAPP